MFIHEMTVDECSGALKRACLGRLACAQDNQPYIVPINFAFDGTYIYGFTTLGQKIEWTRLNPLVCFEVDAVVSHNEWMSIVVFGRYEELPDKPEYENERIRAHAFLQKRAMWWEPAYISHEHRVLAQIFSTGNTELTHATGSIQPSHSHPVPNVKPRDIAAKSSHAANNLMAGNYR